jgi:hypothetical protein
MSARRVQGQTCCLRRKPGKSSSRGNLCAFDLFHALWCSASPRHDLAHAALRPVELLGIIARVVVQLELAIPPNLIAVGVLTSSDLRRDW